MEQKSEEDWIDQNFLQHHELKTVNTRLTYNSDETGDG